jgi:hypothetical protein
MIEQMGMNNCVDGKLRRARNWMFEIEPFSREQMPGRESDDLRLKNALKRAVLKERAPDHLIESIRKQIQK